MFQKGAAWVKKRAFLIVIACCLALTGCDAAVSLGVDALVAAPKLTDEQTLIHQTLIESTGKNISLKYPKNGDNRSAFVVADIDSEPSEEALVFYEINNAAAGENGVRVNVMDKDENGNWRSVYDLAGKGTDIDSVYVSALGRDGEKNIIVGYSSLSIEGKTLQISSYSDGKFYPSKFEDTYSQMKIFDVDKDGFNEIVTTINNSASLNNSPAATPVASIIEADENGVNKTYTVAMASDTVSFANSTIGLVDRQTPGMFVDCMKPTGELQTEIIYFEYGKLQNPMLQMPDKLLLKTTRPSGYYSRDIDGDGIVEIPVTELMPGHDALADEERVLYTSWYTYNEFYTLEKKFGGYYSISDGYQMMFPKRWQGVVTAQIDTATGEAVFYKFDGNIEGYMTELMRIAVCSKDETADFEYQGYEVIGSSGQLDYLVKLPINRREPLILTIDEVRNSFYIV